MPLSSVPAEMVVSMDPATPHQQPTNERTNERTPGHVLERKAEQRRYGVTLLSSGIIAVMMGAGMDDRCRLARGCCVCILGSIDRLINRLIDWSIG